MMRKLISVITMTLLAFPAFAFAQDDFGGGFGGDAILTGSDIDALLGGGGNRGNRGNNNNNNIPNPETLLLQMKDLLKLKKAPLNKDQEKMLKPFIETEVATMQADLEAQFGNRGNNNNNRGNNNNTATIIADIMSTVAKHNTELLTTMKADLTPDQVSLITKAEKDKKVCSVMLDLINPQQLQNRNPQGGGRGGRGGGGGGGNFPGGFGGFDGGGFNFQGTTNNNNNNNNRGGNNQQQSFLQQFPDRAYCTTQSSSPAERLAPIAAILTKGKKPLTADQEKKFAGLIEEKVTVMTQEIRDKDPQFATLLNSLNNQNRNNNQNQNQNNQPQAVNLQTLRNNIVNTVMTQLGIPNNNNNNNNNNNRGRGNFNNQNQNNQAANNQNNNQNQNQNPQTANANPQGNNNQNNNNNFNRGNRGNNFNPQQEIQKRNEELLDKIAAKLNPEQGKIVLKYKYDQIKAKGGVERYRAIMEEEKTPLTPDQIAQIQNLFNANNQAVRQYADQLVEAEMAKVPSFELPPPTKEQQQQNQNRNPNNIQTNPAAQQVIAKVMPEVSKRHALLDRALTDTIMKVLTPAQVASYKLNSL